MASFIELRAEIGLEVQEVAGLAFRGLGFRVLGLGFKGSGLEGLGVQGFRV